MTPSPTPPRPEDIWIWVPFEVDKKFDGWRLDRFLAERLTGYSRNQVQKMLVDMRILKQNRPAKAHSHVHTSEKILIAYPRQPEKPLAVDAALPVLFEDEFLLVVDKPSDLLSHPTDKIVQHTVLGVLRHSRPDLKSVHLLHRLDRETSGVLALAKDPKTARSWTAAMEKHQVKKEYVAWVHGVIKTPGGTIDWPIGRGGGTITTRQAVNVPDAVPAVTRYEVIRRSDSSTLVRCFPETGRLHQIRVHLSALGHPILGDVLYWGEGELYQKMVQHDLSPEDRLQSGAPRLMLHASTLRFNHPKTLQPLLVESPIPSCFRTEIVS